MQSIIRAPEDHRAIVAGILLPANDSEIVSVTAWPAMERYKRQGDIRRATALKGWADLCRPAQWQLSMQAANDNGPTEEGWEQAAWAEPADEADEIAEVDRVMEIRPTVNETMAASMRVSVTRTRHRNGRWSASTVRHIQLDFKGSTVVAYHKDGKRFPAGTLLRGQKGAARKSRSAADIARYLSLPGEPFPPQWRTHDGGRYVEPTPLKKAARKHLESLGVDGSVPRERLPVPVTVYPTAIAKGAHWLGGVVGVKKQNQPKAAQINTGDIEAEMDRFGTAQRLRNGLDPTTLEILDCAIAPMTARAIGELFGKRGKYAERWALRAIDAALDKIAA